MDLYLKQIKSSERWNVLYHYTNMTGLKCIEENNSFQLSKLTVVNDAEENERIDNMWAGRVFAGCFSHLRNDEYFIDNYGYEVCISIERNLINDNCNFYYDTELKKPIGYYSGIKQGNSSVESEDIWKVYDKTICDIM